MQTLSAREFNRDVSAAKRAATSGAVIITDRGDPAFVLVSIDEYRRLRGETVSLANALAMDESVDDENIHFEPVPLQGLPRAVEF